MKKAELEERYAELVMEGLNHNETALTQAQYAIGDYASSLNKKELKKLIADMEEAQ